MRVLVIGGSGHVGRLTLPALAQKHTLRVFDLHPPAEGASEYVQGNVGDLPALIQAAQGMDALLYMAMGSLRWNADEFKGDSFDVNIKGVYLALCAAHKAGIPHAVYTSSMSVYNNLNARYFADEDVPPDAVDLYGFTKRLGEEVCRNAAHQWDLSVNALRLCHPIAQEKWMAQTRPGTPTIATTGEDTARALLAALDYRDSFQAFMISGDYDQHFMSLAKAKRLLGWEPLARPSA